METARDYHKATFAAGCFWDVEAAFRSVKGVVETIAGYTGGTIPNPGYELVESGTTGHAEAVGLVYDPAVVTYDELLDIFWSLHDPTQAEGQGDFTGSQYRSVIFWHNEEQKEAALVSRDRLALSGRFNGPLVTEILPAADFWPAEESHQRFYEKCGQSYCISRQVDD